MNIANSGNALVNATVGNNDSLTGAGDVMDRHRSNTGKNNGTLMQNAKNATVSNASNRWMIPDLPDCIVHPSLHRALTMRARARCPPDNC